MSIAKMERTEVFARKSYKSYLYSTPKLGKRQVLHTVSGRSQKHLQCEASAAEEREAEKHGWRAVEGLCEYFYTSECPAFSEFDANVHVLTPGRRKM